MLNKFLIVTTIILTAAIIIICSRGNKEIIKTKYIAVPETTYTKVYTSYKGKGIIKDSVIAKDSVLIREVTAYKTDKDTSGNFIAELKYNMLTNEWDNNYTILQREIESKILPEEKKHSGLFISAGAKGSFEQEGFIISPVAGCEYRNNLYRLHLTAGAYASLLPLKSGIKVYPELIIKLNWEL